MATFQKVLTASEWGALLEFNRKVKAETGSDIINIEGLNMVRRAFLEKQELERKNTAIDIRHSTREAPQLAIVDKPPSPSTDEAVDKPYPSPTDDNDDKSFFTE